LNQKIGPKMNEAKTTRKDQRNGPLLDRKTEVLKR